MLSYRVYSSQAIDCLLTIPNFDTTTACVAVMLRDVCHIVVSSNQPLSQASAQVSARLLQFGREAILKVVEAGQGAGNEAIITCMCFWLSWLYVHALYCVFESWFEHLWPKIMSSKFAGWSSTAQNWSCSYYYRFAMLRVLTHAPHGAIHLHELHDSLQTHVHTQNSAHVDWISSHTWSTMQSHGWQQWSLLHPSARRWERERWFLLGRS